MDLVKFDNKITVSIVAKKLKVTEKTVKRDIEKLKQKGLLKRVGPAKGGYWEIINQTRREANIKLLP